MASKGKEVVDEVYDFIRVYRDGKVERPHFPGGYLPACPRFVLGLASQDVTIDPERGVWARLFLPQSVAASSKRCPVVLHFHGGGLCTGSPAATSFHRFCSKMALRSQSIWISVDYRLAPENRLPAAYDDAYSAFMWLCAQADMQTPPASSADGEVHAAQTSDRHGECKKHDDKGAVIRSHGHDTNWHSVYTHTCADNHNASGCEHTPEPWLCNYADFSKCFLAGESSGGAIVHYLTTRIHSPKHTLVQVRGLLMIHAAFLINGVYDASHDPRFERRPDTYRWLCLPVGAEWDHPLVNPLHALAPAINGILFPPSIIAVADQDKFCAPGKHYVRVMKQCGHLVELHVTEGQGHCFYLYHPKSKETELLLKSLVDFMGQQCLFQSCKSSL